MILKKTDTAFKANLSDPKTRTSLLFEMLAWVGDRVDYDITQDDAWEYLSYADFEERQVDDTALTVILKHCTEDEPRLELHFDPGFRTVEIHDLNPPPADTGEDFDPWG